MAKRWSPQEYAMLLSYCGGIDLDDLIILPMSGPTLVRRGFNEGMRFHGGTQAHLKSPVLLIMADEYTKLNEMWDEVMHEMRRMGNEPLVFPRYSSLAEQQQHAVTTRPY